MVEEIATLAPHNGGLMVSDFDAHDLLRTLPKGDRARADLQPLDA